MKILIACEYSGIVRDAFAKRGHNAWSCDILPSETPGQHVQGDVTDLLLDDWDMIIAHPPCTYLSNAGARHLYPKGKLNKLRYKKGLESKKFFMQFYNHPCDKVAIENPISLKIFNMPEFSQEIQPYEYGHPFSKKTRLWLKGLPNLKPTNIIYKRQSTKIPGNWFNKGGKDRQKNRSKFFDGFAKAMAEQWG